MKIEVLLDHMSNIADALDLLPELRHHYWKNYDEEDQIAGERIIQRADVSFNVVLEYLQKQQEVTDANEKRNTQ